MTSASATSRRFACSRAGVEQRAPALRGRDAGRRPNVLARIHCRLHRLMVAAHRPPPHREAREVAPQNRDFSALPAPDLRRLVGERERRGQYQDARRQSRGPEPSVKGAHMPPRRSALAEADRRLDADLRGRADHTGHVPCLDPGAGLLEQGFELGPRRVGGMRRRQVGRLDVLRSPRRKTPIPQQPQLVRDLARSVRRAIERRPILPCSVEVGRRLEPSPGGGGDGLHVERRARLQRVVDGMEGDRGQPAVAAVDDAAPGVADRTLSVRSAAPVRLRRGCGSGAICASSATRSRHAASSTRGRSSKRDVEGAVVDPAVGKAGLLVQAVCDELLAFGEDSRRTRRRASRTERRSGR